MWKAESKQTKIHYKHLADVEKITHAQMFPGYRCTPRKSSAIKRRKNGRRSTSPRSGVEPLSVAVAAPLSDRQNFLLSQKIRLFRARTEHLQAEGQEHAAFEADAGIEVKDEAQLQDDNNEVEEDSDDENAFNVDEEARFAEDFEIANRCRL